ncbi:MAG: hypothetical protein M1826_001078 [Phylliscum demangeonii]|nr:MAG: hypothetical protein M1826_001078 [Phylliscum demangeonii]
MTEPTSGGPPRLTFGVEFEIVCRFIRHEALFRPKYPEMLEAGRVFVEGEILKAFRADGLVIRNDRDRDPYGFLREDMWVLEDDLSIDDRDPDDPSSWAGEGCKYSYIGMELKTPVLSYGEAHLTQVETALDILNHKLGSGIQVLVNQSCGLHVHIGHGHDGFPLQTLHFVAGLATVFEPTIQTLHPPHRLTSKHCRPLSSSYRLQDELDGQGRVEVLLQSRTVPDFVAAVNSGSKNYAYNFMHLLQPTNTRLQPYNTIEFRQHEGTTDPEVVLHWIHFCAALVTYAHTVPSSSDWITFIVQSGLQPTADGLRQLLTQIGVPDATALFFARSQNPIGLPDLPLFPSMTFLTRDDRIGCQRMRLRTEPTVPPPLNPYPTPSPDASGDGNNNLDEHPNP